ncbi:MAG: DUF1275 domain-containing protein, partial [Gammaproteobacteria bacterium]
LSGTATLLGTGLLRGSLAANVHLLGVLLSFFAGAAVAGFLLHDSTLKLGRHYDTALVCESLLLLFALLLLSQDVFYGHFLASAACGLQNAMATTYSGAIIRTTHVTGIFTDLGIMLGRLLRGESLDRRKATLFLLIITGFIAGGTFGAAAYHAWQFLALALPAMACLFMAGTYRRYSRRHH